MHRDSSGGCTRQIGFGLVILAVGAMLLADRYADINLHWSSVWPFVLIAMGASRLIGLAPASDGDGAGSRSGVWLVFVGGWGLLNEFQLFGFHYGNSWPLMVIGAGLSMVWRALDTPHRSSPPGPQER